MNRVTSICLSSGKGGVGKTLSSIGIALSLQKKGYRTVLIDGDLNLANVDVLMGVASSYSIFDVLNGRVGLSQVLCRTFEGLQILPASSGVSQLGENSSGLVIWSRILSELSQFADVAIIDAGAGLGKEILTFNALADMNLVVTTPDPHALTDAYALVKTLKDNDTFNNMNLLVNLCSSDWEGKEVFERIRSVSEEFLGLAIQHAGTTKTDSALARLVRHQGQGMQDILKTNAGQAYCQVASKIETQLLRKTDHKEPKGLAAQSLSQSLVSWERSA